MACQRRNASGEYRLRARHTAAGIRADVVGARTDQPVVRVLLEHVRRPARDAADRENRREQIDRDAERVVRRRRVEVDVRVQLLLGLDQRLDALRHLEPPGVAGALAELLRHLAQVRRPRILGVVDAVAEAGNLLLARQLARGSPRRRCSGGASWPISSSSRITSAFAPPCSGPFSAPMAPTIAEWMSVSVAAATRAANVDAFSS